MAPTPNRIAQTSTQVKKQYRKRGSPQLTERQQKQLERDVELEQRAARIREAEQRHKAAKKKRELSKAKEAAARKQTGVGLATQLAGYSHTQVQLKNSMEAFVGFNKRKEEEKRIKEEELTKKMDAIVENIEKEPWDDDDDDNDDDDIPLDLPALNKSSSEQWADDDLDDDTLLQAHDLIMSDPTETPVLVLQPLPLPDPSIIPPPHITQTSPKAVPVKADASFARKHGPVNKVIEAVLDKLPDPLIELLSQDLSLNIRHWNPAEGLLNKLNPTGLPLHRLRIKVGCVVTLLKHLEVSSRLSTNQHLRILRYGNHYLECLVLDGQLEGTKIVLTRVPFVAKYKGLDQHSYQRTQFPIRVATGYTQSSLPRDASKTGFKLPSAPDRLLSEGLPRIVAPHDAKAKPSANLNLGFKLPGLPASKSSSLEVATYISIEKPATETFEIPADCWDDFLDSSTQISRDLAAEVAPKVSLPKKAPVVVPPTVAECLPPLSTQDLDFSMDDLDEEPSSKVSVTVTARAEPELPKATEEVASRAVQEIVAKVLNTLPTKTLTRPNAAANSSRRLAYPKKIAGRCLNPGPLSRPSQLEYELSKLRPSQLPKGMTAEWGKRKAPTPSPASQPPAKRQRVPCAAVTINSVASPSPEGFSGDSIFSIQDATQFFNEDDMDFEFSV